MTTSVTIVVNLATSLVLICLSFVFLVNICVTATQIVQTGATRWWNIVQTVRGIVTRRVCSPVQTKVFV